MAFFQNRNPPDKITAREIMPFTFVAPIPSGMDVLWNENTLTRLSPAESAAAKQDELKHTHFDQIVSWLN